MEPDFHLNAHMGMSVDGGNLLMTADSIDNDHQQQQHQMEPAPTLQATTQLPSIGNFDNSVANVNVTPQMQLPSHLSESDNPLGRFFEENPDLEVLNAEFVQTSEILQDGPVHVQEPQDQTVNENMEEQKNIKDELGDEELVDDDLEEEIEEDDEEEDEVEEEHEEEANEEEEIIPDNGEECDKPIEVSDHDQDNKEVLENLDTEKHPPPVQDVQSDSEQPAASSSRATRKKEEEVDENQCRVCCAKDDLVTLFKKVEEKTVADMLMLLCPSVSIAIKDFLPQFVCNSCLDNVVKAIQLKHQCETTEKELRKKLSRHKNKIRRPAGYVVIDAPLDSDPASEDEPTNDEEFKVSDIASATASEDSESSELSDSKKKKTRSRKRRKLAVTTPTIKSKSRIFKSENISSDDEDNGDPIGNHKRKRSSNSSPEMYACEECEEIFIRKQSLILHRKGHANGREPIACKVCGRKFKIKSAYRAHMEKHRNEKTLNKCQKCSRNFASNSELRRHLTEDHNQSGALLECSKCKRNFVSYSRLQSHKKQGRCPGFERGKSKKSDVEAFVVGRDLFKTVAPLTTTYWSDSFSD